MVRILAFCLFVLLFACTPPTVEEAPQQLYASAPLDQVSVLVTDTLTDVQSDTSRLSVIPGNSLTAIGVSINEITGTTAGTFALQGSYDLVNWFPLETWHSGSGAISTSHNVTAFTVGGYDNIVLPGFELDYVGNGAVVSETGTNPYRFLRVITGQTGTSTTAYTFTAYSIK